MKRILSLILAIMMIASFAVLSVSADDVEIKTVEAKGATNGSASLEEGDIATVTKKYFAVSFTMNAAEHAGIHEDNGCCGLMFGDNDNNCVFIPYDGGNTDTQRTIGIDGAAKVCFGQWWGNPDFGAQNKDNVITDLVDKDVTILVLGEKGDDGKTTFSAYINGNQVTVWGGANTATGDFGGRLKWAIRLNNVTATCKFAESDTALDATVFDEKAPDQGTDTPENPGNPGTDTPVAPKTGEATAIVALVSVLALAGVVVASKKRA